MFIKRSAFLLLTGVLAQQACTSNETTDPDTGGTGGDGGSATSAGAGAGGAPDNQAGSSMSVAGSGEAGAPGGAGGSGGAGLGGEGLGGASLGGESSGGVGGATAGAGGSESCDDSVGTPGDCSVICTDESAKNWCDSVLVNLKPAVAETYYNCIDEGSYCDDFTYECVSEALAGACSVPDNDLYCSELVDLCANTAHEIDPAGCHALIDGLSETGMEGFVSCIETDGCSFGLWSCVEGLQ